MRQLITKLFRSKAFWLRCVLSQTVLAALLLSSSAQAQVSGIGNFIVGGQVVGSATRYPFMVSIQLDAFDVNFFSPACGGSLIAQQWVLTAAHCVQDPNSNNTLDASRLGVFIGATNLRDSSGTFIRAEQIIPHPEYDPQTVQNDIALIRLASPFVAELALLPATDSPVPLIGESSIAVGWGAIAEDGPSSSRLREVALPIIANTACFPTYPQIFDSRLALCAGGSRAGGQDSCSGDSGGPLLVARDDKFIVAGIISLGNGCARSGVPGVYTRVEAYTDWITSIVPGTLLYGEELVGSPVDSTAITRIGVNSSTVGQVFAGEVAYFELTGARQVDLTSIEGDADLYLISDSTFQEISNDLLRCESITAQAVDSCVVNQSLDGTYAVVFGFTDAEFSISSQPFVTVATAQSFSDGSGLGSNDSGGGGAPLWLLATVVVLARRLKR